MKVKLFSLFWMCSVVTAFSAELKDGVYAGKAGGNNGPIHVVVTVKDGRLVEVEVTRCSDRRAGALKKLCREMVESNGTDVDAVSGATYTSDALKAAVKDALKKTQCSGSRSM